jgi:hypothetical protein
MPSKTKNRRIKRKGKGKGTRGQRGGDWMHSLSFGTFGIADDPTTPKQSWSDWFSFKSDPSKPSTSWSLDSITPDIFKSKPTVIETNTNPMQPTASYAPAASAYATSASDVTAAASDTAYNPMQTNEYEKNGFNGGKKTKTKTKMHRCHHKHKHSKSCSKR